MFGENSEILTLYFPARREPRPPVLPVSRWEGEAPAEPETINTAKFQREHLVKGMRMLIPIKNRATKGEAETPASFFHAIFGLEGGISDSVNAG